MFRADLHIHSRFSRATSKALTIPNLAAWAGAKGIDVLATGDFTHPVWRQELRDSLELDENSGLYSLKKPLSREEFSREIPQLAGMEFIKFPSADGKTPVVMRDIAFCSRFGDNNDLRSSDVLKKMQEGILPKIIAAVGEENVLTIQTDLTALDGLKPYGVMESKISLPTLDFYRQNVEIFDKYKVDEWWWLATPESAPPHSAPKWIVCVAPSGCINYDHYRINVLGVRPFLIFNSSIFESSEN